LSLGSEQRKGVGECHSLVGRAVDSFKEKLPFLLSIDTYYFGTLVWYSVWEYPSFGTGCKYLS